MELNGPVWVTWVLIGLTLTMSIFLIAGKGSFLIAGYNMASEEEKAKYNVKRLCRIVGGGTMISIILVALETYFEAEWPAVIAWLYPWGMFGVIVAMVVLANTVCKIKK